MSNPTYSTPPGSGRSTTYATPPGSGRSNWSDARRYDTPSSSAPSGIGDKSSFSSSAPPRAEGEPLKDSDRFSQSAAEPMKDKWWILLYVLAMGAFITIAIMSYISHSSQLFHSPDSDDGTSSTTVISLSSAATYGLAALLLAFAGLFSVSYLYTIHAAPREVIWATLIGGMVLLVAILVMFSVMGNILGIFLMVLCVGLYAYYIYAIRPAIPFATALLSTSINLLHDYQSVFTLALTVLLAQCLWFLFWFIGSLCILMRYGVTFAKGKPVSTDPDSTTSVINVNFVFIIFTLMLVLFWSSQVLKNILHTTVSGLMARWYFLAPLNMPLNPVSTSLKASLGRFIGSIILASLVTAIIKAIRTTFQVISKWLMSGETNCCTVVIVCICECILSAIEAVVQYINMYALSYVAIYGQSYLDSASMCFDLMKRRGLDAVCNDDLIGGVLLFGSFMCGCVCALVGGLCGAYLMPNSKSWGLWAIIGFVVGILLCMTMMSVIESSVVTLFVCLADDPTALLNSKPTVWNAIVPMMMGRGYEGIDLEPLANTNNSRPNSGRTTGGRANDTSSSGSNGYSRV